MDSCSEKKMHASPHERGGIYQLGNDCEPGSYFGYIVGLDIVDCVKQMASCSSCFDTLGEFFHVVVGS